MSDRFSGQLDKILAMADSSHDSEAVVAVRKARQMLSRDGLSFSDLARAAVTGVSRAGLFSPQRYRSGNHLVLQSQVAEMHNQVTELQVELTNQTLLAETWRRRAVELEEQLNLSLGQSARWRELAKETVERLWNLGQSVRLDDAHDVASVGSHSPNAVERPVVATARK